MAERKGKYRVQTLEGDTLAILGRYLNDWCREHRIEIRKIDFFQNENNYSCIVVYIKEEDRENGTNKN